MNFLAHAYLSFGEPEILVGNMISDFVKGKRQYDYATGIQRGIKLHRAIDDFTDQHPVSIEAKQLFRPAYRLYAAAFIDIVYDHFLATDPLQFADLSALTDFAAQTYKTLNKYQQTLPDNFRGMLPYMQRQNWLFGYSERDGMLRSFSGMVRRSKYMTDANPAFVIFTDHYDALKNYYQHFFPALREFALHRLQELQKE